MPGAEVHGALGRSKPLMPPGVQAKTIRPGKCEFRVRETNTSPCTFVGKPYIIQQAPILYLSPTLGLTGPQYHGGNTKYESLIIPVLTLLLAFSGTSPLYCPLRNQASEDQSRESEQKTMCD